MRAFLALFFALCFPAQANDLTLMGVSRESVAPPAIDFQGSNASAAGTSHTFASFAIGAECGSRLVAVAVSKSSNTAISSITVGGIGATLAANSTGYAYIYYAAVPTGTTATISIVVPSSQTVEIGVWRICDANAAVPISTGDSAANPGAVSLSTVSGAVVVSIGQLIVSGASSVTITGATQRYSLSPTVPRRVGGGDAVAAGLTTNVGATYSPAPGTASFAAAAWF